ncbi:MAG: lamin tail domain-containing protein [Planctomycetota bacterium]
MKPFQTLVVAALCGAAGTASAQTLTTDVAAIDSSIGGTQVMTLDAGAAFAGDLYFIAGTTAGDSPGFAYQGLNIPLNFSTYLTQTISLAVPELQNSFSVLDGAGMATAQFTIGGGFGNLAGLTVHHAYVVITGTGPLTFGAVSNAAPLSFVAGTPTLVISEFMANPGSIGDSTGEWVEIYNPGATPVDIEGWTLADLDFDSTLLDNGGAGIIVPAGGQITLGNSSDPLVNGGITHAFDYSNNGQFFLSNSSDEIVLLSPTGIVVDQIIYDGTWPFADGVSAALGVAFLDTTSNDDPLNWTGSTCTIAGTPCNPDSGTPGTANDQCSTGPCVSGGQIIITEIMQNPSAVPDNDGEYFEVYNTTGAAIDMLGWTISAGGSPSSEVIATSVVVPAGGYALFARMSDPLLNGGLPTPAYDYVDGLNFGNSSQSVVIRDASSAIVCQVDYDNGATFPDPNGAAMSLTPSAFDVVSANIGANWCEATSVYGLGDAGTPGAANDVCP